jgi:hypothetical protein
LKSDFSLTYFPNFKFRKISSSFFQYSERTIAITETNNTSKERSHTQLFGDRKFEGVTLSKGLFAYFLQKGIEQKVNLMSGLKKK